MKLVAIIQSFLDLSLPNILADEADSSVAMGRGSARCADCKSFRCACWHEGAPPLDLRARP